MSLLPKLLLVSALVAGRIGSFAQSTTGEIQDTTYTITSREVKDFDKIHLQGPFNLYISQGTSESLKMDAPNEILSRMVAEVDGHTLNIHNKHDNWSQGYNSWYSDKSWWHKHKRITVYVTVKNLERLHVSGSGNVYFTGGITAESLRLRTAGSAKVDGKVDVKKLYGRMSGSGNIKLAGSAASSRIRISGSGNFSAREMVTIRSKVHVSGSGHAEVNASEEVHADVRGSAHVSYTGTAKVSSSKSGSGGVSKL